MSPDTLWSHAAHRPGQQGQLAATPSLSATHGAWCVVETSREGVLEYILLGLSIIATTISLLPKRDSFDEMAGDHLRMALSIGVIAIMATTAVCPEQV